MGDYVVLDVFTDRPFGGNPLAVFPDARDLPEAAFQKIAREFNFSETTFVLPPEVERHTARVRIFTPTGELPFAGHPLIGTAVALASRGLGPDMVFELAAGPLPVHAAGTRARFTTDHPLSRDGAPDPETIAACCGLSLDDLRQHPEPPVLASVGLPMVLAEVADVDALARARPSADAFRALRHALPQTHALTAVYLYVQEGDAVRARMFAPLDGIDEDPATGNAAAALAAHLADLRGGSIDLTIRQGIEMGRPSAIEVSVRDGSITVAGNAVEMMRGTLSHAARSAP